MSTKPTLCFLTGTLNAFAGAERMTAVIANELARRGYTVHILSLWDTASCFELEPAVRHDALFAQRPSFKTRYLSTVLGIRRYLKRHRIEVLIEVDTMLTLFTLLACVGLGVRRIAWEHCNFDQDLGRRARRLARRLAVRSCEHVVVLTQRDREKWERALGARNVVVIPNALPFAIPAEPAPRTSKVALAVGRLTYAKGFDVLLRAWALVADRFPDWRLRIIGDGDARPFLEKECQTLGITDTVAMPGDTHNTMLEYRKAGVFALSSRYEGFGLVLIEAMACGLPVVSTRCETGPAALLTDGDNAHLVDPNDPTALANGLARVMGDAELATRLASRGREFAHRFEAGDIVRHWQRLLVQQPPCSSLPVSSRSSHN